MDYGITFDDYRHSRHRVSPELHRERKASGPSPCGAHFTSAEVLSAVEFVGIGVVAAVYAGATAGWAGQH